MKKFLSVLLITALLSTACNDSNTSSVDNDKKENASSSNNTGDCVEGKYTMTENGTTRAFVFNADKSGQEEYTSSDIRPFTWSKKDDKTIHIVYKMADNAKGPEYDLNLNCEGKTISYYGATYTRQ